MTDETKAALDFFRSFFADLFAQNARDGEARWLPVQVNEESRAWVRGNISAWNDAAKLMREVEFKMPTKGIAKGREVTQEAADDR